MRIGYRFKKDHSRVFQNRKGESTQLMEDNRVQSALQAKMVETMQRDSNG